MPFQVVNKIWTQSVQVPWWSVSSSWVSHRLECELPSGGAPRGVVVVRQLCPASQGLLEQCFCREAERESLCVQEYECARGSKWSISFHSHSVWNEKVTCRHTHTLLCILSAKLHEANTCICKQALWDTNHPSSGVFPLISSSLYFFFFVPITTHLTLPQPNLAG